MSFNPHSSPSTKQPLSSDRAITVAICTHNRSDMLKKVLKSLSDQTLNPDNFEVVIANDASTDDTEKMVKGLEVSYRLTCITHEVNRGITASRNTTLLHSRGEIILFIDDDVVCHQDLLRQHFEFHQKHKNAICNGWVNHVSIPERPKVPKIRMEDLSNGIFWTSNVSVHRAALFQAGLFDEEFIEYGYEDKDMGLRLLAIGLKAHKNWKAIGFHVKPPLRRKDLESHCRRAVTLAHTALIYVKKHNTIRAKLSTGIISFPWLLVHRLTKIGNWLENFCLARLNRPSLNPEDELKGLDYWCIQRLAKLYYYDEILCYRRWK